MTLLTGFHFSRREMLKQGGCSHRHSNHCWWKTSKYTVKTVKKCNDWAHWNSALVQDGTSLVVSRFQVIERKERTLMLQVHSLDTLPIEGEQKSALLEFQIKMSYFLYFCHIFQILYLTSHGTYRRIRLLQWLTHHSADAARNFWGNPWQFIWRGRRATSGLNSTPGAADPHMRQ